MEHLSTLRFEGFRAQVLEQVLWNTAPCLCAACYVTSVMSNTLQPMDCSPPGSSIHGDSVQASILQWVAMPSSMGSSQSRDQTHVSYVSCIGKWVLYHYHHLGSPSFPAELNKISMALPSLIAMWFGWLWGRVLQEHKHMAGSTKMSVTISWKTQCKKILLLKKAVLTNNVQGTLHFS